MLKTTNYNLNKIELTDSPPDITVLNPNWDTVDAKLKLNEEQINSLAPHQNELVTAGSGAHGLKIEKGVFTPYIYGSTTAGVNTYTSQKGVYVKNDKICYANIELAISAKDAAMAGSIRIGGLPFVPAQNGGGVIAYCIGLNFGSGFIPTIIAELNLPSLSLNKSSENGGYNENAAASAISNNFNIAVTLVYRTI